MQTAKRKIKRLAIVIAGGMVVIIAISYPGPGWLLNVCHSLSFCKSNVSGLVTYKMKQV